MAGAAMLAWSWFVFLRLVVVSTLVWVLSPIFFILNQDVDTFPRGWEIPLAAVSMWGYGLVLWILPCWAILVLLGWSTRRLGNPWPMRVLGAVLTCWIPLAAYFLPLGTPFAAALGILQAVAVLGLPLPEPHLEEPEHSASTGAAAAPRD
jgi:hypothetical protein